MVHSSLEQLFHGIKCFLMVQNLHEMGETQFRSLGLEDPPEKEMATHSSILSCEVPWAEQLAHLSASCFCVPKT